MKTLPKASLLYLWEVLRKKQGILREDEATVNGKDLEVKS